MNKKPTSAIEESIIQTYRLKGYKAKRIRPSLNEEEVSLIHQGLDILRSDIEDATGIENLKIDNLVNKLYRLTAKLTGGNYET